MKIKYMLPALLLALLWTACNQAAKKDKTDADSTDITGDQKQDPGHVAPPFSQEVTYKNYRFLITTAGEGNEHHFKLIPSGLSVSNDTLHEDVHGRITGVIISDMDGDDSPEIGVVDRFGPDSSAKLHVFSVNDGKSISMVNFPDPPATDKIVSGYYGKDAYEFVENTLVRRFPLHTGDQPTGKTRQLQYKLKPGEAMKQLVLDKTVDF